MCGKAILSATWDEAVVVALGANLAPAADEGGGASSAGMYEARLAEVLEAALARFSDAGLVLVKRSRWWRSTAWPDPADPPFLNGVAIVQTTLASAELLATLHRLEAAAGRVRSRLNAPRALDLDLIAYGRRVEVGPPVLPHPRAQERRFVMGPLAEIAPGWRHPVSGERADALARTAPVGRDAAPL